MNILFVVAHPDAAHALVGLADACGRADVHYSCFFTGDGVRLLQDGGVLSIAAAAGRAVVCEYSWARHFSQQEPPIEQGSQTDHSAMIGDAERVVSL